MSQHNVHLQGGATAKPATTVCVNQAGLVGGSTGTTTSAPPSLAAEAKKGGLPSDVRKDSMPSNPASMAGKAAAGGPPSVTGKAGAGKAPSVTGKAAADGPTSVASKPASMAGKVAAPGPAPVAGKATASGTAPVSGKATASGMAPVSGKAAAGSPASVSGKAAAGSPASVSGKVAAGSPASVSGKAAAGSPASVSGKAAAGSPASVSGKAAAGSPASVSGKAAAGSPASVSGKAADGSPASVSGKAAAGSPASVPGKAAAGSSASVSGKAATGSPASVTSKPATSGPASTAGKSTAASPASVSNKSVSGVPSSVGSKAAVSGKATASGTVSGPTSMANKAAKGGPALMAGKPATNSLATAAGTEVAGSLPESQADLKEKTPMSLLNELAHFNNLKPQYKVIKEEGPPHAKLFTVQLVLGEQCCEVKTNTIKKAQHMAAQEILDKTTLSKPVPRHLKHTTSSNSASTGSITPTVMLNGLAMQLGLQVSYHLSPSSAMNQPNPKSMRSNLPSATQQHHKPNVYTVELHVGNHKFSGEGHTRQAARHAAATKALVVLQTELPLTREQTKQNEDGCGGLTDRKKVEVSYLYEQAMKRNLPIKFEILQDSGPPHMKAYRVLLRIGDLSEEGEGKSKKLARAHAAAKLMPKIQSLPQLPQQNQIGTSKTKKKKKKGQTAKMTAEVNQNLNPISRLVQIQQGKKEREPEYTMLLERSLPLNRHEFVIQAKVGEEAATGSGLLKKVAKRNAAEAMLVKLGYKPSLQLSQPKPEANSSEDGQKMTVTSPASTGQKGLLHLSPCTYQQMEATRGAGPHVKSHDLPGNDPTWCGPGPLIPQCQGGGTAALARELLHGKATPVSPGGTSATQPTVVRPNQQLDLLAATMGFQVQRENTQQGSESLSTITLLPMHVTVRGTGPSMEQAQEQAAFNALKHLSDTGLDTSVSKATPEGVSRDAGVLPAGLQDSPQGSTDA
uniref:double-stranded RNA-binding protein Staufen homolog 2-like isoform X2 n=1 Tax=Myxine glutinosa TaxID=7769 RepID=UPI00358EAB48